MNLRSSLTFILLFSCASLLSTVLSEVKGSEYYPLLYKENCVFPFYYNNKQYTDCTTDGDNGNTPWCSMTTNYQGLINYCYDFRYSPALACSTNFTMPGNAKKFYTGCDYLSISSPYKQCKTANSTLKYRYCSDVFQNKTLKLMDNRANCDSAYKKLSSDHTMCFGPSPYANVVTITDDEKQELLDLHNTYRSEIPSRYMFKLYWDDELAKLAQAHANLCAFEHDLAINRLSPKFNWKNGQNIVMSTEFRSSPASLFDTMFYEEKQNFYYGKGCTDGGNTCLHYTQAMISNLTRVGCGQTHCVYPHGIERFVTCNYIQSQYSDTYQTPYVESDEAAVDCPEHQDNGLCDCGDKICAYDKGEYLDPATCTCKSSSRKRSVRSIDVQGSTGSKKGILPNLSKRSLKKRHIQ